MQISKLIKKLESIRDAHGDIGVDVCEMSDGRMLDACFQINTVLTYVSAGCMARPTPEGKMRVMLAWRPYEEDPTLEGERLW